MQQRPHIIERAFQLAGECGSLEQVRRRLIGEGYVHVEAHLQGSQIKRDISNRLQPQLRALAKARKRRPRDLGTS